MELLFQPVPGHDGSWPTIPTRATLEAHLSGNPGDHRATTRVGDRTWNTFFANSMSTAVAVIEKLLLVCGTIIRSPFGSGAVFPI